MATFLQGIKLLDGRTKGNIASIHSLKNKTINNETSFSDSVKNGIFLQSSPGLWILSEPGIMPLIVCLTFEMTYLFTW